MSILLSNRSVLVFMLLPGIVLAQTSALWSSWQPQLELALPPFLSASASMGSGSIIQAAQAAYGPDLEDLSAPLSVEGGLYGKLPYLRMTSSFQMPQRVLSCQGIDVGSFDASGVLFDLNDRVAIKAGALWHFPEGIDPSLRAEVVDALNSYAFGDGTYILSVHAQ